MTIELPILDILPFEHQEQFDQLDSHDYEGFLKWVDSRDEFDNKSSDDYLKGAYRYLKQSSKELDPEFWRKHYVAISLAVNENYLQKYSGLKNQILTHLKDLSTLLAVQHAIIDAKADVANDDYLSFVARAYAVVNMPDLKLKNIVQVSWMYMYRILNTTDDVRFVAALLGGVAEIDNRLARLVLQRANALNDESRKPIVADTTESSTLGEYDVQWIGFDTLEIAEIDTSDNESIIVGRTREIIKEYTALWNSHFWGEEPENVAHAEPV